MTVEHGSPALAVRAIEAPVVLVVDDQSEVLHLCRLALESAGMQVEQARNAREARRALDRRQPDVLLTDVTMPGFEDGLDLCRAISADPRWRDTRVLAMSADTSAERRRRCIAAGAAAFLPKPLGFADLVAAVEACLDGSRPVAGA